MAITSGCSYGVAAVGLTVATLISSIVAIATNATYAVMTGSGVKYSLGAIVSAGTNYNAYYLSGLAVASVFFSLVAALAAAEGHKKGASKPFRFAAKSTFLVFILELTAFAKYANDQSTVNDILAAAHAAGSTATSITGIPGTPSIPMDVEKFTYGAGFAFLIITWLLSMPTFAFSVLAGKSLAIPPAQAQAQALPLAEPVAVEPVAEEITKV